MVAAAYAKQEPDRKKKNNDRKTRGVEGRVRGKSLEVNGYWKKFCGQPLQADTLNTERRGRSLSWPIRRNASWLALRGWIESAIGNGKEEAVVLWPGICSTIASFRYHFILGVSRFLTVCETSSSLPPSTPCSSLPLFPSASVSEVAARCSAFYFSSSLSFPNVRFLLPRWASFREFTLLPRINFQCEVEFHEMWQVFAIY